MTTQTHLRIAILFQDAPAPSLGGAAKPFKPNGYRDSSADIGYAIECLSKQGEEVDGRKLEVVTPVKNPRADVQEDWSFPDSTEGITQAIQLGATILWANTVLHRHHPLFTLPFPITITNPPSSSSSSPTGTTIDASSISYIGHLPSHFEDYDHKINVNNALRNHGLKDHFPKSWEWRKEDWEKGEVPEGVEVPIVIKPVRGRGSHGVSIPRTLQDLQQAAHQLFAAGDDVLLLEEYLEGDEVTVTVMPPGTYDHPIGTQSNHFNLPIILRYSHTPDGVLPYSGSTPITTNSRPFTREEIEADTKNGDGSFAELSKVVGRAADLMGTKAMGRVDCRRRNLKKEGVTGGGRFYMFDWNCKPNMTGPNRPLRSNQIALTGLAAQTSPIGWSYEMFVKNLIGGTRVELVEGMRSCGEGSWDWEGR